MPYENILNTLTKSNQIDQIDCKPVQEPDLLSKNFPTKDENIWKLFEIVRPLIPTKVPILLTGEHGVGKEKFAKAIHIASGRSKSRFIEANCANLPQNFFEMELFGISNTYFSDIQSNHGNYFEVCTLMLDEVTNLDRHLQFNLLSVLKEQQKFLNQSTHTGRAVDARIIACSTKNLQIEVTAGRFSAELLSKLNIIHLEIPPLRMRPFDIDLYSELFFNEFKLQYSRQSILTASAKQALAQYTWPGNLDELKNVLHRAVLLHQNEIKCENLQWININTPTEIAMAISLPQITIAELEQYLILQTLRRHNGNRTHTAKALGISLRALRYKIKELLEYGYEILGSNKDQAY